MSERNNWDEILVHHEGRMLFSTVHGSPIPDYAGQINIRVGKIIDLETKQEVNKTEELVSVFKERYIAATKNKRQYRGKIH